MPSGRSALLSRAGPAALPVLRARAQCGPLRADRALGVRNRHTFAESPCFIQSTESGAEMGPVGIQNGPTMERQRWRNAVTVRVPLILFKLELLAASYRLHAAPCAAFFLLN